MNKEYLQAIRNNSCYPSFRRFVGIVVGLTYAFAALLGIVAIAALSRGGIVTAGPGLAAAAAMVIIAMVSKEALLMLADIADATIDGARRSAKS